MMLRANHDCHLSFSLKNIINLLFKLKFPVLLNPGENKVVLF